MTDTNVVQLIRPTEPLNQVRFKGSDKHSKYINILSKIAVAVEPVAQARIASALVYRNDIVAVGINQKKSHPFQKIYGKNSEAIYLHSEVDCIKNALKHLSVDELSRSVLYVCRVKYEDQLKRKTIYGLARPCPGCQRAIAAFNIRRVFYSLDYSGFDIL